MGILTGVVNMLSFIYKRARRTYDLNGKPTKDKEERQRPQDQEEHVGSVSHMDIRVDQEPRSQSTVGTAATADHSSCHCIHTKRFPVDNRYPV
jgi:hypothetical protein